MAVAQITFKDRRLYVKCPAITPGLNEWREIQGEDDARFRGWIESYQQAVKKDRPAELLLKLGKEIYAWLNTAFEGSLERLCSEVLDPPLFIEFGVPPQPGETEQRFLEVPWEILADESGHLAAGPLKFTPLRRFGNPG
ncbi:MAG: hypothetical protein L0Y74_00085, partial [candidate division Zixibacteria bacterium]|nr:hypothetical protein [candidate division Zixibacteria bacterium]